MLLVFLSLLFNAPTRHTKAVEFLYIYICILHNYKLILLVAPQKKDLLKLYLLLNYNISDNHSIGQGKIKQKQKNKQKKITKTKQQKKNDKSVCWSLLLSKQIRGLSSLLSRASLCQAKEAPGSTRILHCFFRACERGPRVLVQGSSPQRVGAQALPCPRDVRNVVGTAWSPSTSGWGSWSPQGWPDPPPLPVTRSE